MKNDVLLSKTISYLRFPLTVGVVFIHFNIAKDGFSMHGVKYGLNHPEWYVFIINLFSEVIPRICVPLFFLISGFLFFYRKDFNGKTYFNKLCTRVRTLVLPFFLWNIIAILLYYLKLLLLNAEDTSIVITPVRLFYTFFANYENEGIFVTNPIIGNDMTLVSKTPFPIDVPLWYVRDLIVMVILAPLIFVFIKKLGGYYIFLLGVIWFFIKPVLFPSGGYAIHFFTASFFFSSGAYFSINRINFVDWMSKFKYFPFLYILLAIIDALSYKSFYNHFVHEIGILVGVISVVIISSILIERGRAHENMALSSSSFFVFAFHTLIMSDIGKLILTVCHLTDYTFSMLFMYFLFHASHC